MQILNSKSVNYIKKYKTLEDDKNNDYKIFVDNCDPNCKYYEIVKNDDVIYKRREVEDVLNLDTNNYETKVVEAFTIKSLKDGVLSASSFESEGWTYAPSHSLESYRQNGIFYNSYYSDLTNFNEENGFILEGDLFKSVDGYVIYDTKNGKIFINSYGFLEVDFTKNIEEQVAKCARFQKKSYNSMRDDIITNIYKYFNDKGYKVDDYKLHDVIRLENILDSKYFMDIAKVVNDIKNIKNEYISYKNYINVTSLIVEDEVRKLNELISDNYDNKISEGRSKKLKK